MKLFLHWLRWDLIRFRGMLGVWTMLMLAYGILIAWHRTEDKPWDPAVVAGVWLVMISFEVLAMLHFLTADPAVGVDLFWKTRPPRGIHTGGPKLVIVLTAFVLLPMGVHALSIGSGDGSISPQGEKPAKWHEVLEGFQWWLPGLLAVGAAAARSPGGAMVRIVIGIGIAMGMSVFCSSYLKVETVHFGWGGSRFTYTFISGLWFSVGAGLFLLARCSSRGAAWVGILVWLGPALLLLFGILIGPHVERYQQKRLGEQFPDGTGHASTGRRKAVIFLRIQHFPPPHFPYVMKLFLHWLRWDLGRFRWMLAAWTLLVLGYAAFLGWMHADILTIDPDWMDWSGSIAKLLGAVELLMLLHLFSTDPAGGVNPFWKTRPPTGFAVAGSKLVLALGFFVVVPMAAWFAMEALCVKPGAVTHEWEEGVSWTRFLWMVQTLVVSVIALGAAVVRTPWQIPLRLAQGFALAVLPALLALVFKPNGMGVVGFVVERAAENLVSPSAFWLWGAAGCGVFLLARWNHTPARSWRWIVAALPCAILLLAPNLPARKPADDSEPPRPVPDPTVAARIQVKGLSLRDGGPRYSLPRNFAKDDTYLNAIYEMKLKVSGLPHGLPAHAGWRELSLTAPDGRVVEADRAAMQAMTIRDSGGTKPDELMVKGAVFQAKELVPLSLLPCRAEGTLRVMLKRPGSATLRLEPGNVLETPMAWYALPGDWFHDSRWRTTLTLVPRRGAARLRSVELEHLTSGERRGAQLSNHPMQSGFLMQSMQSDRDVPVSSTARDLASLRLTREFSQGVPVKDWQLRFTWEVPDGFVDLPVVVEPFILPRQNKDRRELPDLIAAVPWTADAPADRVRVAVGSVLLLANQPHGPAEAAEKVEAALITWLDQVPAGHLPVLLELARDNLPPDKRWLVSDGVLTRRIASLLSKEAAAELRGKEPALFEYLKDALLEAGLVSKEELEPAKPWTLTDQALAEAWDQRAQDEALPMDLLEEAMRRGLPWAKLVIVDLMQLNFYSRDLKRMFLFMPLISDCPSDSEKARRWLRSHAERLEWDPAAKRWVLPPSP